MRAINEVLYLDTYTYGTVLSDFRLDSLTKEQLIKIMCFKYARQQVVALTLVFGSDYPFYQLVVLIFLSMVHYLLVNSYRPYDNVFGSTSNEARMIFEVLNMV